MTDTGQRYRWNRKWLRARDRAHRRSHALEDSAFDELDEWMVACPAADTPQATG